MRLLFSSLLLLTGPLIAGPLLTTQHIDISLANGSTLDVRWADSSAGTFTRPIKPAPM